MLFFKAFGGATHTVQSYQSTSKPYYDKFGDDLFDYPEEECNHTSVITKCICYMSTVDIRFSFPIFDDRQMFIESTCILDFFVHEDCQRKGHGTQLMKYMMKVKKIKPRKISLYQPSKSMLRFMNKNYGLTERLKESLDVYTFFDILGKPGDPEQKFDLYQKNIEYQEEQKRKPNILEYGIISNAGKKIVSNTPSLHKTKTYANLLDNGFAKPLISSNAKPVKTDNLSTFVHSK